MSEQEKDQNGYITIERNPITRVGVFQYMGRGLPGADPEKIYNVYRPAEEVAHPDALKSFELMPIINDHVMLGEGYQTPAEEKGVHGTTGQGVFFEDGIVYSPIRIFSDTLKSLIESGKKALSVGYRCAYEKSSGVFNGQVYDYIQRNIRGNHLALVHEARMGKDIAVLDGAAFDSFDLALHERESAMSDETKKALDALTKAVTDMGARMDAMDAEMKEMKKGDDEELDPDKTAKDEEEKKKKEAEDAEEEKKKKDAEDAKLKSGMDSLDKRLAAVEGRGPKDILAEVSRRDAIAKDVSHVIGTFDHATMTADEVATYALDKLELKAEKGQEHAVLAGFLAGRKASTSRVGFALDSKKTDGLLDKRLKA